MMEAEGAAAAATPIPATTSDGLPAGWQPRVDGKGRIYFADLTNCTTTWLHPVTKNRVAYRQHPRGKKGKGKGRIRTARGGVVGHVLDSSTAVAAPVSEPLTFWSASASNPRSGPAAAREEEGLINECPICLVNEDDYGKFGMCCQCGQLYCGDCNGPEGIGRLSKCPTCRSAIVVSDKANFKRLQKMLQERSPGRHTPFAQSNLGFMYQNGTGVAQSHKEAVRLYRLAAGSPAKKRASTGRGGRRMVHGAMATAKAGALATEHLGTTDGNYFIRKRGGENPKDFVLTVMFRGKPTQHLITEADGKLSIDKKATGCAGIKALVMKARSKQSWWPVPLKDHLTTAMSVGSLGGGGTGGSQGHAHAQYNLGIMYQDGAGVAQSDEEAVKWYQLAAVQGLPGSQSNLGLMYQNGTGVAQNHEEAVKWYQLAADQGYALAQSNLGFMYQNGTGVAQDHEEAVKWYQLAADQGYALAQANLGFMYQTGTGVAKSRAQAAKWFRLATETRCHGLRPT